MIQILISAILLVLFVAAILSIVVMFLSFTLKAYAEGRTFQPMLKTGKPRNWVLKKRQNILDTSDPNVREQIRAISEHMKGEYEKNKKISYEKLTSIAPNIVSAFETDGRFVKYVANSIQGVDKLHLSAMDRDRMFLRLYTDSTDFVNWHYDNNFSSGRRFTAIIPIKIDSGNTSMLQYMDNQTHEVVDVDCDISTMYIFEGDNLFHRVTPQSDDANCDRIVLIIPLYEKEERMLKHKMGIFARDIVNRFNLLD